VAEPILRCALRVDFSFFAGRERTIGSRGTIFRRKRPTHLPFVRVTDRTGERETF
jgi:hypothetical protein